MEKHAHFIGIAGMGMSATAILLKEQGWDVTGSDSEAYPPGTTQLDAHGIRYASSYDAKNIPKNASAIIIGKNAKLIKEENEEVRAALGSGIRIASFPEILREITKDRETIVVAGSYGKSTTTALLAWCLSENKVDVGWFIGAAPHNMNPAHLGSHPVFVIEGDEYPTSHDDPRPKFAHYAAHDALVTAAVHDHVNIYKTQEEFINPFRELVGSLPEDGLLVLCADEAHTHTLREYSKARVVTYGTSNAAYWSATNIVRGETTHFDLMHGANKVITISTSLLGSHNIQNIVGACALLLEKKLVSPADLVKAIAKFHGLSRRLDLKTTRSSIPAYEGFGSSREKLQAAIAALKAQHSNKRLVVIFEPHSFSWRNKKMLHWFDTGFSGADLVILYKPTEQGSDTHEQSTQKEMADRLLHAGVAVVSATTKEEALSAAKKEIRNGDFVLLSSSGPMDGLIDEITKWLDNTFA